MIRAIGFIFVLTSIVGPAYADILSFPGAEGYGAVSVGGRKGEIIEVTNLKTSGHGSLQAALNQPGPRIIVFRVTGVIRRDVKIRHSNITIAGQTAPYPGITIEGRVIAEPKEKDQLHDIIVRFLRIRPPPTTGYAGDAIQLPKVKKLILDHLSLSWANDEMIDIIHSSDVTIQWSTIEESDPLGHDKGVPHNFALISAYPGSGNISIHHNLFANNARRIPCLAPYEEKKPGDFRNNVVYNFREGLSHDGHIPSSPINIVGNYYKFGPNARRIIPFNTVEQGRYFISENYIESIGNLTSLSDIGWLDQIWVKVVDKGTLLKRPVPVAPVITDSARVAYNKVLTFAGMFPRDRVSVRTIEEVKQGKGSWSRNAPHNPTDVWYMKGLAKEEVISDSDGDGMSDDWEVRMGLDASNSMDSKTVMSSGYTAIEQYLNYRAKYLIKKFTNSQLIN
jgi:hypothetical protein